MGLYYRKISSFGWVCGAKKKTLLPGEGKGGMPHIYCTFIQYEGVAKGGSKEFGYKGTVQMKGVD